MTDELSDDAEDTGVVRGVPRRWSERTRSMDPENRRRVLDACAIRPTSGWVTHFALMMVLSVIIAVMGLSADSPALVIGAMLLAPLMTPVLGVAASLTMALGAPLKRSLVVLALATVGAVALSWFVSLFLRDGPLGHEVLARTSPDARDLIVALAAGAAGAYATSRPDLSSSLPGVAIAVALVPPLGVVGITLEAGRGDLARGAALLYVTNLTAIVVVGVFVFVLTGFAPPRRLALKSRRVIIGYSIAVVLMIAAGIPLTRASFRAADEARDVRDVEGAVQGWLTGTGDQIDRIEINGNLVQVRVTGFDAPPSTAALEQEVREVLGKDVVVAVRWTQTQLAPARDEEPSEEELRARDVQAVVDQWLESAGGGNFTVSRLDVSDGSVRLDITSAVAPPGIDDLSARLSETLGVSPEVEVNWLPLTPILPDDGVESLSDVTERLRRLATDWSLNQPGVMIEDLRFDGTSVVVDVVGPAPPDAEELADLLTRELGAAVDVAVWFTQRELLVPAPTPTSTPRPTPTPIPSPTPSRTVSSADPAAPTPTPG